MRPAVDDSESRGWVGFTTHGTPLGPNVQACEESRFAAALPPIGAEVCRTAVEAATLPSCFTAPGVPGALTSTHARSHGAPARSDARRLWRLRERRPSRDDG